MLRLGMFRFDATPPVGAGTDFGLASATSGVRDPLYIRGFLLSAGAEECLLIQCDWAGTMNRAHRELRAAFAAGAGVREDRVVVHSTHQHDAPLFDFEIEPLLGQPTYTPQYWQHVMSTARQAGSEARRRMVDVAEVGTAETRLWGYASSRDVVDDDGKLVGNRWSRTTEAHIAAAPVGIIDPMLRTLAFRTKGPAARLLAVLSFYASHPQVASGSGQFSADAPGEAVRLLAEALPGTEFAVLMVCAGNVTAGKYTSATDREGNLRLFGRRLADAIRRTVASLSWFPVETLGWDAVRFPFPAESDKGERLRRELADPSIAVSRKRIAAAVVTAIEDADNRTYELAMLTLGEARVLFFGGEPFVEYQLFAQSLAADRFIAAVGNCGDSHLYLPRASSFRLGAYEAESFCWCTPEIESLLEASIRRLLR